MVSQSVLRVRIERKVAKHKSQTDAAEAYGLTRQHLSLILGGGSITDDVARKFGYKQIERQFVKIEE